MITVVVGHRGTGKTELMTRLQFYVGSESAEFVDLDTEIEKKIGKPLREFFLEHGEAYFREMERQLFLETLQKPHKEMYLVLGAGFDLNVVPENVRVLWVRRKTDRDGRIFLNRPRLNPEMSLIEEFRIRAAERESRYSERADEVYLMPEGIFENHHQAMQAEKAILLHRLEGVGGILTILPEVLKTEFRWNLFKERFTAKGLSFFELRDDLLSLEECRRILQEMPDEHFIFSFRKKFESGTDWTQESLIEILARVNWVDWPWELGTPEDLLKQVSSDKVILSLHDRSYKPEWMEFENKVAQMKYAPEVSNFKELMEGHEWQRTHTQTRSFLPRSPGGRWEWYRLLNKGRQRLNFWREGTGSAEDQPSLWAWLMTFDKPQRFAAVLGDPVAHSFTPLEQSDFFHKRGVPVFAVSIGRDEWDEALPILRRLGLSFAAVTSPHKENAAGVCHHLQRKALNTLYWNAQEELWQGTSTDEEGFLELIEGVGMIAPLQNEIFVWGGGGVLEMIQKSLPHASYFSSRTGQPRQGSEGALSLQPKIVIWAAPRAPETLLPPLTWNPAMVIDLNYKEDSLGREYAQWCGANYQSGLVMFMAQARGQRVFWGRCEEKV